MKKFTCECCGAPLRLSITSGDEWVCEYCGTRYKQEHEDLPPIRIETFQNPVQTLYFRCLMSDIAVKNLGMEKAIEFTTRRIAENMVDKLIPFIRIESEYDPMAMEHIVTGRIRVVEDNYKF